MLNEVLKNDVDSSIKYEILSIASIKEADEYGGYRAKIMCTLENIRQTIPLDIVTGDIITPQPIDYTYTSLFGNEDILIKAYPIETMLAKKFKPFMQRGF